MKTPKVQILILMFAVYAYPVCTQSTPATALTTLGAVSDVASLLSNISDKTDAVYRTQLLDLRSRVTGVITTIKEREEANRNAEETLQIVEVELNQSIDLTWSLAQEYLKLISTTWQPGYYGVDYTFTTASLFTKLHTVLGNLKITMYQKSGRYSLFNDVPRSIRNKINELNKTFFDTCVIVKKRLTQASSTIGIIGFAGWVAVTALTATTAVVLSPVILPLIAINAGAGAAGAVGAMNWLISDTESEILNKCSNLIRN